MMTQRLHSQQMLDMRVFEIGPLGWLLLRVFPISKEFHTLPERLVHDFSEPFFLRSIQPVKKAEVGSCLHQSDNAIVIGHLQNNVFLFEFIEREVEKGCPPCFIIRGGQRLEAIHEIPIT